MQSVDHSNIDGPPLAVKCVRKFGPALGGEVTCVCVCVYVSVDGKGLQWNIFAKGLEGVTAVMEGSYT